MMHYFVLLLPQRKAFTAQVNLVDVRILFSSFIELAFRVNTILYSFFFRLKRDRAITKRKKKETLGWHEKKALFSSRYFEIEVAIKGRQWTAKLELYQLRPTVFIYEYAHKREKIRLKGRDEMIFGMPTSFLLLSFYWTSV